MTSSDESRPDAATASGVDVVPEPPQLAAAVGPAYATWGQRVVAAIFDNAILAGVTWLALGAGVTQPSLTPVFGTPAERGWPGGPLILIPIGALAMLLVLQATTGWIPGKLVVGIRVVREGSPAPAGLWTTLRHSSCPSWGWGTACPSTAIAHWFRRTPSHASCPARVPS